MIFADDVKAIKTSRNKRSGGCILHIFIRSTYVQNLIERQCKKGIFHLILVHILSILILSVMNRVGGEVLPNGQNLLSMTKIIYRQSLRSIYTAKIRMCLYQAISSITYYCKMGGTSPHYGKPCIL